MKVSIICLKDGDPNLGIPITDEETECLAVWPDIESAQEFAANNPLCQSSEVILLDLQSGNVVGYC